MSGYETTMCGITFGLIGILALIMFINQLMPGESYTDAPTFHSQTYEMGRSASYGSAHRGSVEAQAPDFRMCPIGAGDDRP